MNHGDGGMWWKTSYIMEKQLQLISMETEVPGKKKKHAECRVS